MAEIDKLLNGFVDEPVDEPQEPIKEPTLTLSHEYMFDYINTVKSIHPYKINIKTILA